MAKNNDELFMKRAIELSRLAVEHGNEPFGAVLCKNDEIVFEGENKIYTENDPTYHAENTRFYQAKGHYGFERIYPLFELRALLYVQRRARVDKARQARLRGKQR